MFGGLAFLARGNMACGVMNDDLIVRVGPDGHAGTLAQPYVRIFDVTGRAMKGWVLVVPEGCETDAGLEGWVHQGLAFALTLPAK